MKWNRFLLLMGVAVAALAAMIVAQPAAAHGGGAVKLAGELIGPYKLTIWTSPEPARVGDVHVTVGVGQREDGSPITNAEVLVEVSQFGPANPLFSAPATSGASVNKFLYEANLVFQEAGTYTLLVTVNSDLGSGRIGFDLDVLPTRNLNWFAAGALGVVLVVAVIAFKIWEGRRQRQPA